MRKKKEAQAAAPAKPRVKPTKHQRRNQLFLLLAVVIIIFGIWAVRLPKNYVNMFIGHYDGTTSVLEELKGVKHTDEEKEQLLPLQTAFDDWKQTHLRDDVSITSNDGLTLSGGWYNANSDVTVILLHSFDGSSSSSDYLYAPYYADKGYNILLPDSRAHGDSDGDLVTYGQLEGQDVANWMQWVLDQCGSDTKIILHGCDLGANAALAGAKIAQQDSALSDSVTFVVAESPVVNLYDAGKFLLNKQFNLPSMMMPLTAMFGRDKLGESMKSVDLAEMTEGSTVPALFLEGTQDKVIDPDSVTAFADTYAGYGSNSEILTADCRYGMVYGTEQDKIESAIDQLIAEYFD
jgi:uncharacterized protein